MRSNAFSSDADAEAHKKMQKLQEMYEEAVL